MKIVVTGADRPLGGLLCRSLGPDCDAVPAGLATKTSEDLGGREYQCVDLLLPEAVEALVKCAGAIVHALPFDPLVGTGPQAGTELLDQMARSTYVVVMAALQAGVHRIVLISQMALLEDYPEDYVVNPEWRPLPRAEAVSLAPYMAELVCRESARTGQIEVICLRFGELDAADGTCAADAVQAVTEAVQEKTPDRGHSWDLRHVVSSGRFAR